MTSVTFGGLGESGEDLVLWNLRGKDKQNKGDSAGTFALFPGNFPWVRDLGSGQRSFIYFEYHLSSALLRKVERKRKLESGDLLFTSLSPFSHV